MRRTDGRTDLPEPVLASAFVPAEDPRVAAAGAVLSVGAHRLAGGAAGGGGGQAVVAATVAGGLGGPVTGTPGYLFFF